MVLLEVVIELLLEYVLRELSPQIKQKWMQLPKPSARPFVAPVDMINRDHEQRAISAAVSEPGTRVIYFTGSGGSGKTRLLQESERLFRKARRDHSLQYGQIIDLYHADLHSVSAIQNAIMQALDPKEKHFAQYREARYQFDQRRLQGMVSKKLNVERQNLNRLFLTDYAELAQSVRLVLRFDTLETLQRESDLIQTLCQLDQAYPIEGYEWLVKQCGILPNTVVLLAGRPQPHLSNQLAQINQTKPGRYEEIQLTGLNRADSQALLAKYLQQHPTAFAPQIQSQADHLWHVTKGLPVQLAILAEVLLHVEVGANIFANLPNEPDRWEETIIQQIFDYNNEATRPLFFLALARKGLTVDLLHYLEPDWSYETCEDCLQRLSGLSIIKTRQEQESTSLFLHDALYELFDAADSTWAHLDRWRQHLMNYHRDYQVSCRENRTDWLAATVNLLYYELQHDASTAFYDSYLRWSEAAIKGNEVGLDLQLRDELLRFLNSSVKPISLASEIERDSGIRWIKRLLIQGQYQQAIQVSVNILQYGPYAAFAVRPANTNAINESIETANAVFNEADNFFWGHLLTYYGEALAYVGASEQEIRNVLRQAIDLLESYHDQKTPFWLQQKVLGRAYNVLAYLERIYGHYGVAVDAYRLALDCFAASDLFDEQADTLNNLAFLLATLGDYWSAKQYADLSLKLRQQAGQIYPVALSHNTRGRIYALQGDYEWGERECKLAWDKFSEIEAHRGIGLACNALGFILRCKAESRYISDSSITLEQLVPIFEEAEEYLLKAIDIFDDTKLPSTSDIYEPIRLWEAYNELGSLYDDWANLCRKTRNLVQTQTYYNYSLEFQRKAIATAQAHGLHWQLADTYDDLAQLYAEWGNIEEAKQQLQYGLQTIIRQYQTNQESVPDWPKGEAYWLVLGKAYWQQGVWLLSQTQSDQREGIAHLIKAASCFNQYWPGSLLSESRQNMINNQLQQASITPPFLHEQIDQVAKTWNQPKQELLRLFDKLA